MAPSHYRQRHAPIQPMSRGGQLTLAMKRTYLRSTSPMTETLITVFENFLFQSTHVSFPFVIHWNKLAGEILACQSETYNNTAINGRQATRQHK